MDDIKFLKISEEGTVISLELLFRTIVRFSESMDVAPFVRPQAVFAQTLSATQKRARHCKRKRIGPPCIDDSNCQDTIETIVDGIRAGENKCSGHVHLFRKAALPLVLGTSCNNSRSLHQNKLNCPRHAPQETWDKHIYSFQINVLSHKHGFFSQ